MTREKDKKTSKVPGKVAEKAASKVTGKVANKITDKSAAKTTGKTVARAVGKTTAKTADKSAVKPTGKSTAKTTDKVTGKTAIKAAGKTTGKTVDMAAAKKSATKPGGKVVEKTAVKKPAAKLTGNTGKITANTTGKTPGTSRKGGGSRNLSQKRDYLHRVVDVQVEPVDWREFVEKMEQSLLEQKSGIVENLIASNNDFKEIVEGMDPKDFADIASDDIDRKMIEALGSQELKRLKQIDSALTRIKQGKYGHCIKCEKHIPPARLEAIPYALMCIACKSDEERRNR